MDKTETVLPCCLWNAAPTGMEGSHAVEGLKDRLVLAPISPDRVTAQPWHTGTAAEGVPGYVLDNALVLLNMRKDGVRPQRSD